MKHNPFHTSYLISLIAACLLLASLPALSDSHPALEKVSLQLNWKYQFQFAGFIAAKEKGFYNDVGLDVDLLEYQNGQDIVSDVLENKINFGIHHSSIAVKNKKLIPSTLLATYFQQSPYVLVSTVDIKTPHDLRGKRIMIPLNNLNDTPLGLLLSHFYLTDKDITQVTPSFNIQDFIDHKVDAAAIFTTNELFHLKKKEIAFNIIAPADYGYSTTSVNLFTSTSEVAEHPKRTQDFINASNKGWEYALTHQQEIISLIYNKYSKKKSIEALFFEAIETQKLMPSDPKNIGSINESSRETFLHQLKRSGLLDDDQELPTILKQVTFTQEQMNYLLQKEEITMCVDPDWMPFEKIEKGQHLGIAANVFSLFQEQLPIPIRLIETGSWEESIDKAKSRDCDIFSLASNTDSRKEYMDFTSPYIDLPIVLATKNNTLFIDTISEVKNKKLGIVKGYSIAEFLRKRIPDINIIEVESVSDGLERVESGELFGFIDNLMTIAYAIQHDFTDSLKVSARFQDKVRLAVATRNDDPQLHYIFQSLVNNINDAQMQYFYNSWVSVKEETNFDYRVLWLLLTFVTLAITGFIIGLRRLNKRLTVQNKYIEQEKKRFQILFEQAGNPLLLIQDGAFIDCNEKAFKLLGYDSKEDLMSKNPAKDISPKYQPDGQLSLQKCKDTTAICFRDGSYSCEWLHYKKDGSEILIYLILTRLDYQDKQVLHVSWRDLTEQKEYEQVLLKATENARQADEAKSKFLANMSHELRTPMHGILSFAQFGLRKFDSAPRKDLNRYFSHIQTSGKRLLHLLNDLLDLSKLEAGKIKLELRKKDIIPVLRACITEQEQRMQDLDLTVNINYPDTPILSYFDSITIGQVITNLLSNAVKFSHKGSKITIDISKDNNQNLLFTLKDEGIGIPDNEFNAIFDAFIQSSKTRTEAGGTGLGLAICKQIIDVHKGTIWAENNADKGAAFSFTLPCEIDVPSSK